MKLKLKESELAKCTLMIFHEDQLIDGKVKYQAGKIYPIHKTSVDRWIKRGCEIFTEEMEDAILEKGEEAKISIPLFGFEHLVEPVEEDEAEAPPVTETVTKEGETIPPQPPTEANGEEGKVVEPETTVDEAPKAVDKKSKPAPTAKKK